MIDDTRKRGLMVILEAAARDNKICPGLAEMGAVLGVSAPVVSRLLAEMKQQRLIDFVVEYRGTGIGKARMVTIVATGQTTPRPDFRKRGEGSLSSKYAKAERNELERAKTALRRFGHVVFDAGVTDGASGKGLIKVDNRIMAPADVIAMAQQTGAL